MLLFWQAQMHVLIDSNNIWVNNWFKVVLNEYLTRTNFLEEDKNVKISKMLKYY